MAGALLHAARGISQSSSVRAFNNALCEKSAAKARAPWTLLRRTQATAACAVEWKRAAPPVVKKKAPKAKQEKKPFKLLSFRWGRGSLVQPRATPLDAGVSCTLLGRLGLYAAVWL